MSTLSTNGIQLTDRERLLIMYIHSLDKNKRHRLVVVCRGREPWEIEEHVTQTKVELTIESKQK